MRTCGFLARFLFFFTDFSLEIKDSTWLAHFPHSVRKILSTFFGRFVTVWMDTLRFRRNKRRSNRHSWGGGWLCSFCRGKRRRIDQWAFPLPIHDHNEDI